MPVGLGAMVAMSAVPAVVQGVQGFIQSGKARKMLDNLERPQYEIPQSVMQGTQRAINAASSFQMPGQDAYQQSIDQASSGALYNITQNATSGPEALAAMTGVYGAQMGAQNQMALAAAQDYQRRDQLAQQALMTRGEYEDKAWMTNVYQPYAEEAQAASALAEAGKINAYQAVKGLAGVGANALMMKSLGMFDTDTGTNKVAPTTSPTNADPNFISNFNPNFQGFNKYNQPQFKSITERVSSFVPNLGITSKPNPFVPMMGDANSTSVVPGQTTGIQFNPIPGVTDGLTESPMINKQSIGDVISQITGRNSFMVGTTNNGGVGALNVTPPVVSNTAPVQPTAVIPSQPAPVVPAPAIVSPGFAQAQQTMNAVEAGAIQPGTYTADEMKAQDVAAAAAAAPEPVVAPEATAPAVPPAPEIKKMTPLETTSLMVSRLPMDIIKSSPSLQKFAEQSTTKPENGEVATPSEGAAFKFGDNETSNKVATDPNIPWKDFMQGNWTYEGEECNMKGKCPSDDDRDGARRTIGSMVYMDDFPRISKESDENMSAETFIERVNTEGTKENKLWKTAMLPMPATMAMINTRYKK